MRTILIFFLGTLCGAHPETRFTIVCLAIAAMLIVWIDYDLNQSQGEETWNSKYSQLIMAVERKFPGESRHQTALRYIRKTEERANQGMECSEKKLK